MSKSSLKDIVAQIQKSGAPPPPPPPGYKPDAVRSVPVPDPGAAPAKAPVQNKPVAAVGSSEIKEMQIAIQNFAKTATDYKTKQVRVPPTTPGGKPQIVEKMDANDPRKDFNDFISEQYTNGTSIHGVEFNPDPNAVSDDSKKPTDNIEMDNVLDSLRRIGSPKPGEKQPDGVWDFRTQNAVMQTYALADSLTQITAFMAPPSQKAKNNFTSADLSKFANAIPKVGEYPATHKVNDYLKKISPDELKQKANVITSLVNKLSSFYQYYYAYVINHPAYKAAIEKTTPLITVKPGGEDRGAVPAQYAGVMKQLDARKLTDVKLPQKQDGKVVWVTFPSVPLSTLKDAQSFRSFMLNSLKFNEADINSGETQAAVLGAFDKHIKNVLSAEPPPPKTVA
jgi:hypothetical protein